MDVAERDSWELALAHETRKSRPDVFVKRCSSQSLTHCLSLTVEFFQQSGSKRCPAGLMAGSEALSGFPMEVLVE